MKLITAALFATVAISVVPAAPHHSPTVVGEISLQDPRAGKSTLPIIKDDYEKARAEAIKRKLPLFVDVWAPW